MQISKPYLLIPLLLCLVFPDLYGQAALGIYAQDVEAIPSTVVVGDSVKYSFDLENRGNATYSGQVAIWVLYSSGTAIQQEIHDVYVDTLPPNGRRSFLVGDLVDLVKYDIGGNTILIWPKSDQANVPTVDSSWVTVTVEMDTGASGIEDEMKNRVALFPNPLNGNINLRYIGSLNQFEHVRITNIQGKEVFFSTHPEQAIDLTLEPKGIYFLELRFKDGLRGVYRLLNEK